MRLDEWLAGGERAPVELRSGRFEVFQRVDGAGPWLTFLHGFPTSSFDYAAVAPPLGAERRLLLFDFLGFGDSDKPRRHDYSLLEQADLCEALWRRHGVAETGLVAHDYGSSVAVELLARQAEGRLAARLPGVLLMNAGLYLDAYRPRPIQRLLLLPVLGALVSAAMNERAFARSFAALFPPGRRPSAAALHEHWLGIARRGGRGLHHRLIRYMPERQRLRARFEGALAGTRVPLQAVWGLDDPISGAVVRRLRLERPDASVLELPGVGHYPQLEAPERVVAAARAFFGPNESGPVRV